MVKLGHNWVFQENLKRTLNKCFPLVSKQPCTSRSLFFTLITPGIILILNIEGLFLFMWLHCPSQVTVEMIVSRFFSVVKGTFIIEFVIESTCCSAASYRIWQTILLRLSHRVWQDHHVLLKSCSVRQISFFSGS